MICDLGNRRCILHLASCWQQEEKEKKGLFSGGAWEMMMTGMGYSVIAYDLMRYH
jgi:hypothetical protein